MSAATHLVYTAYDAEGDPLYVGMTSNLDGRLCTHRAQAPWWGDAAYIAASEPMSREESLRAERERIHTLRPKHNKQHNVGRNRFPGRELLTTGEAAKALRVHPQTIRRWIASGQLPAICLPSGVWRVRRSVVNGLVGDAA
jgi:excisionase family DNA binding protein